MRVGTTASWSGVIGLGEKWSRPSASQRPKWRVMRPPILPWGRHPSPVDLAVYGRVTALVGTLTGVLWLLRPLLEPVNVALLYLLPVLWSAVRRGWWPAFYAASLGVLALEMIFIRAVFSHLMTDLRYVLTFAVFLAVAGLTARQAASLQHQAHEAERREAVTASLYALSRKIAAVQDLREVVQAVILHVSETFHVPVWVVLPDPDHSWQVLTGDGDSLKTMLDSSVLQWVFRHGEPVGFGGRHRPELLYVPLKTEDTVHGVMCLGEYGPGRPFDAEQRRTVESLAGLAAVSIARVQYEKTARLAQLSAESERLRTALLDSISHELRTPLTAMMGAMSGLTDAQATLSADHRAELMATIHDGIMRLNRLITNLLGMVRLESGMLRLKCEPSEVADVVGVALQQLAAVLHERPVAVEIPEDMGPVVLDEVLMVQALVNVISNAAKYSPPRAAIRIAAEALSDGVRLTVEDEGIGISSHEATRIFHKFYRGRQTQHIPGTGLGLSITHGIVLAHRGRIRAEPKSVGGTRIVIELPWEALANPTKEVKTVDSDYSHC